MEENNTVENSSREIHHKLGMASVTNLSTDTYAKEKAIIQKTVEIASFPQTLIIMGITGILYIIWTYILKYLNSMIGNNNKLNTSISVVKLYGLFFIQFLLTLGISFGVGLCVFNILVNLSNIVKNHTSYSSKLEYIYRLLKASSGWLRFLFACVILYSLSHVSGLTELVERITNQENSNQINSSYFGIFKGFFDYFYEKVPIIFFIGIIFFIKSIIVFTLNYTLINKAFLKKKSINDIKLNVLRKLNEIVNAGPEDSIEHVVSALVLKIGRDDNTIYYTEAENALGEEAANKLFAFGDPTGDYKITKEELMGFYKKTFGEQKSIINRMQHANDSIESIDTLLFIICIILSIMLCFNEGEQFKTRTMAFLATVISGSYIFSDTIKKFLTAMAFVFFIRAFEVGDIVKFGDHMYVVKEIKLLSTVFSSKSLTVTIANDKLYDEKVTNYSISESIDVFYPIKFETVQFKSKSQEFLKGLNEYFNLHKATFTYKPYFNNVSLEGIDIIKVNLVVGYQLQYQEFDVIEKRMNMFTLAMYDIMKQTGLVCK